MRHPVHLHFHLRQHVADDLVRIPISIISIVSPFRKIRCWQEGANLGLSRCSWVYPTECFPLATRAKGTALAVVAFSVAGGIVNTIIPYLISAVGFWVFVAFAVINFLMLIPIYLFYVGTSLPLLPAGKSPLSMSSISLLTAPSPSTETANRHLEDLDILFATESPLVWRAEKEFARRKAEGSGLGQAFGRGLDGAS